MYIADLFQSVKFRQNEFLTYFLSEYWPTITTDSDKYAILYNDIAQLLNQLMSLPIQSTNIKIIVSKHPHIHIHGRNNTHPNTPVNLHLMAWSEWLGAEIITDHIDIIKTAAAVLWEMTFYGFSAEEIEQERLVNNGDIVRISKKPIQY